MTSLPTPDLDAQRHYEKLNDQYHKLSEQRANLEQALHRARNHIRKLKRENSILIDVIKVKYPDHTGSDSESSDGYASSAPDDMIDNIIDEHSSSSSAQFSKHRDRFEHSEKRTRRTGKRDDRTQPKHVQSLPRRPNGAIALPVTIGRGTNEVIIYDIGRVVWDREGYHNSRYIWPVGFKSKKYLPSLKTPLKKTGYISEILDGGGAPVFQVTPEDSPDTIFSGVSASGVWKQLLDQIASLGVTAKTHASGPEMLGLSNLAVTKAIQELPNANKCTRYVMQRWLPEETKREVQSLAIPDSHSMYSIHE
ncbi:hypothetical protein NQZ79_g6510 [Umbelopsis isabellina]|nr:hypothetical protein NQZ79_g6510 [Umbelopsis isabellina]